MGGEASFTLCPRPPPTRSPIARLFATDAVRLLWRSTLGQKELCSVTAYLTHGASDTDSYDRVPAIPRNLPETQKWGFWGCYADRYNKKVPETNRIGFPPVNENEMWPPKVPDPNGSGAMVERPPCDNVADLLIVLDIDNRICQYPGP